MIAPGGSGAGYSSTSVASIASSSTTTQATGSSFFCCAYYASTGAITSITDNFSNTYAPITAEVANPSDGGFFRVYGCTNGNGGATHVATAHMSLTQTGMLIFVEVTGGATASILDAQNAVYDNGGSPYACSVTTTNLTDLLVGFVMSASQNATESFSSTLLTTSIIQFNESTSGLGAGGALCVRVTSTGTYNAAISDSVGYSKALVAMIALQEAGGGAPPTPIAILARRTPWFVNEELILI